MQFLGRYAAVVVMAVGSMLNSAPAWSKSQKITVAGHAFFFDVPIGFSLDRSDRSDDMATFHSDGYLQGKDNVMLEFSQMGHRMDVRELLLGSEKPQPLQHRGSVEFAKSGPDDVPHVMEASAPCGGGCFVYVGVTVFGNSKMAEGESIFQGYLQALASGSFQAPGYDASSSTPATSVAAAHWPVITGSWPTSQQDKMTARLKVLSNNGIAAKSIRTDNYPGLTPGLVAVVVGPMSRDTALAQLDTVLPLFPDAFIKETQ